MQKKFILLIIAFLCFYIYFKDEVFKEKTILIGTSVPLSGTINSWGKAVFNGVNSYFKYVNENNIIEDKKIEFLLYDDKYEPELTLENTKKLIYEKKVFALFGFVGTPTVKRILPILFDENIPFFGSFTGASFLRNNKNENIINFRSSYNQEIEALINYIQKEKKLDKIAIFYQNDDYGEDVYLSILDLIKKRDLKLVAEGSYKRNTLSISHAFSEIKDAEPEVIFMIGAYKTNALFIKKAKENEKLKDVIFCNISFGDANSIVKELNSLGSNTTNLIFSQVVPSYLNTDIPSVKEYQTLMKKYYPEEELGFLSFEAFLSSKILVNALEKTKDEITKEKFLTALKTTDKNFLEGIPLEFNNSQLLNKIYLFEYKNNDFKEINNEK